MKPVYKSKMLLKNWRWTCVLFFVNNRLYLNYLYKYTEVNAPFGKSFKSSAVLDQKVGFADGLLPIIAHCFHTCILLWCILPFLVRGLPRPQHFARILPEDPGACCQIFSKIVRRYGHDWQISASLRLRKCYFLSLGIYSKPEER